MRVEPLWIETHHYPPFSYPILPPTRDSKNQVNRTVVSEVLASRPPVTSLWQYLSNRLRYNFGTNGPIPSKIDFERPIHL